MMVFCEIVRSINGLHKTGVKLVQSGTIIELDDIYLEKKNPNNNKKMITHTVLWLTLAQLFGCLNKSNP